MNIFFFSRDDSSEPESGRADEDGGKGSKSFVGSRGVLKRMHNVVLSDEKEKEPSTSTSTSTSSPSILSKRGGGGKRVQLPFRKSPTSEQKEPEIIGEGLPLIQRLRLLKQKEERERKQQEEREAMMQSLISSKKPQSPPSKPPESSIPLGSVVRTKVSVEVAPSTSSVAESKEQVKPVTTVAVVDKRESVSSVESTSSISSPPSSSLVLRALSPPLKSGTLLGEAAAIAISKATAEPGSIPVPPVAPKPIPQMSFSPPAIPGTMASSMMMDPLAAMGRDRSASASSAPTYSATQPLSAALMRPSALHFRQKTYGSVDDLSPEFSRLPFVKKLKILNERQKIAALLVSKTNSNVLTRSTSEGSNENTTVTGSTSNEGINEDNQLLHSVALGRRTQSNQEQLQGQGSGGTDDSPVVSPPSAVGTPGVKAAPAKYDQSPPEREVKPVRKGGWSTVGQLVSKCDAPSVVQKKPAGSTARVAHDSNATKCLTKLETDDASSRISTNSYKIPSRLSPSPTSGHVSGSKKRKRTKKVHMTSPTTDRKEEEGASSSSSSSTPSPPEMDSTETPERRNLKSILKRLAKSEEQAEAELKRGGESSNAQAIRKMEERRLLKAPTIEGYAARHRKFAKNVTFHRQAVMVVSPEDITAGAKTGREYLRLAEGMQVVRPEPEIGETFADFESETGIATQTEQLIPVSEHSIVPDVSCFDLGVELMFSIDCCMICNVLCLVIFRCLFCRT